jgi:importin subunit alpha-6/7
MAINAGALQNLKELTKSTNKIIRKEVCWALSNITAGSVDQIQNCIDNGIID